MIGAVLSTVRRALGGGPAYNAIEPPEEGKQYVYDHGKMASAVDSEFVPAGENGEGEIETVATAPMELTAKVPEKWEEGEKVKIAGPHGPIEVAPPAGAKPNSQFTYRLVPMYEFRVEVPPGARPGLQIEVMRRDGVQIAITVPPGLKPGDIFEVLPPALIVRVPEGAKGGDLVVYKPAAPPGERIDPKVSQQWIRARVPPGAEPGGYFAARLPVPGLARRELPSQMSPEKLQDKEGSTPLLANDDGSHEGVDA